MHVRHFLLALLRARQLHHCPHHQTPSTPPCTRTPIRRPTPCPGSEPGFVLQLTHPMPALNDILLSQWGACIICQKASATRPKSGTRRLPRQRRRFKNHKAITRRQKHRSLMRTTTQQRQQQQQHHNNRNSNSDSDSNSRRRRRRRRRSIEVRSSIRSSNFGGR